MELRAHLLEGQVIPAFPLALDARRKWSERHQRALARYYVEAGAGGLAVGVHSTQFEIRAPEHGLFRPVLELARETVAETLKRAPRPFALIAGVCGDTEQAVGEAEFARATGYDAALLSLTAVKDEPLERILAHVRRVADVLPVVGFYLQPAVGGRVFPYRFWREFADIPGVVAIKIAPFNRYQTLDVVRAVVEADRDDIALYTGNDDNIVSDLLTPFRFSSAPGAPVRRIVGGLLGQWGVWTRRAVEMLAEIKRARVGVEFPTEWLTRGVALTDINAAVFDAANGFAGVIPGIHEVLRSQGLMAGRWCLDPALELSPGQVDEIARVRAAYPEFNDDVFVAKNLDRWLT
ncbi:dihydrodipicolinate synthase family protein [Opitutales bacterium ASA1]|uniref:dihydrodipicolinate synthase family protein n=1 Tax=Congregicoccus parvus TaxID=3081749 RepID=UPI002B2B1119|nr:dihydrodipicolinate synthase family protein [Opitutales bacterium ASA1]